MPDQTLPNSLLTEIDDLVGSEIDSSPVPGVALGIVRGSGLATFRGYGAAHLDTGEAPGQRSIARVASVTKTFTATAIMQLRDASLLALDDPLLLHIPEFTSAQAVAAPLEGVTLRRMLTHHSGLSTEHPDLDWDTPEFPDLERVLGSLELLQVVIPQDSQWKYSNLAYSLLGEVVSRLSGRPYTDYVLDEIIRPLGLANTAFDLSPEQSELKMTGYSPPFPGDKGFRVAPVGHLKGFSSAGQLHSNIEDLATWISFQLGSSPEQVLSAQSLAEMRRPVYIADDWSSGQCIGWRATRRGDRVYLNHGGALHGFATSVVFNVPARTGVILLVNTWPVTWNADLALRIAETVIEKAGPAVDERDRQEDEAPVAPGEHDGLYRAEPGLPVRIRSTRRGLSFAKPEKGESALHAPASLESTGEADVFKALDGRGAGELAVFSRGEDGKVSGFRLGGFMYRKVG